MPIHTPGSMNAHFGRTAHLQPTSTYLQNMGKLTDFLHLQKGRMCETYLPSQLGMQNALLAVLFQDCLEGITIFALLAPLLFLLLFQLGSLLLVKVPM